MSEAMVVPLPRDVTPEQTARELRRRGVARRILVVEQ